MSTVTEGEAGMAGADGEALLVGLTAQLHLRALRELAHDVVQHLVVVRLSRRVERPAEVHRAIWTERKDAAWHPGWLCEPEVAGRWFEAIVRASIAVLTARDPETARQRAMGAGASGFLRKPVDHEQLFQAIRRAVGVPEATLPEGAPIQRKAAGGEKV